MRSCRALRRCLRSAASIEPISGHQHSICGSASRIHHTSSKGCEESVSWFNHLHRLLFSGAHLAGSHTSSRIASSYLAAGVGLLLGALSLQEAASSESERNDSAGSPAPELGSIPKDAKLDTEGVVQYVRRGIDERLQSSKEEGSQIPQLTIAANGQQVAVRFSCRPTCDMSKVIEHVIGQLGGKDSAGGSDTVSGMVVRAWDSPVLRHVIISTAEQSKSGQTAQEDGSGDFMNRFSVSVFEPLVGDKPPEVEFLKFGYFSAKELDTVASVLKAASRADNSVDNVISPVPPRTGREGYPEGLTEAPNSRDNNWSVDSKWPGDRWRYRSGGSLGDMPGDRLPSGQRRPAGRSYLKTLESLERMGVKVYGLETIDGPKSNTETINWDSIAGYQEQKREIEDTVLLALQRPEVYDKIARGTRRKFESNRPRAILFEGPPGTGKTSCARVIASQAKVPLLYVPVESLVSKYYGESEKSLASIFSAGNELPDGAIVFLDEIDSLATARDNEMHEATRRMLSVLLRQMDGFEQTSRVVVIAATNRKQDLDSALLSRFDSAITFNLPDQATRGEIASQYARHLTPSELASLAAASEGMSGRDLHDVCQQAERRWASKLIRGVAECSGLPPIAEYLECANKRQQTLVQFSSDNGFHRGSPLPSWQ